MKHALVSGLFALVLLIVVIALTLSIVKSNSMQRLSVTVPQQLAGMRLSQSVQGAEAIRQISQLHHTDITLTGGVIAQYIGDGTKAMLWVGTVDSPEQAEELIRQMTERIEKSPSNVFSHLGQINVKGLTVHSVMGMGQMHYYYARGSKTVWIALDPNIAPQGLREIVDNV